MKRCKHEDIHNATLEECCANCRGLYGCNASGDYHCDSYKQTYDEIKREWDNE